MTVYNVITVICFALLTLSVAYVIYSFITKTRADRISFIRGFKKGKCIAVFLVALPLISIGYIYDGANVLDGVLSGLAHVIDFVVLKFNLNKINALIASNLFYRITVYYCCILVILNATLFALSFIGQQLWQFGNWVSRTFTGKEKLFIFGKNDNSELIYRSNKTLCAYIVDNMSAEDGLELYKKRIAYISINSCDDVITKIMRSALKNKKYAFVINTEDDEKNLNLCNLIIRELNKLKKDEQDVLFKHLRVYVFGDPKFEAIYDNIATESCGCIRYKNKYQMLAMNFIDKYPLTKFMDGRHIDYDTSLIKDNVDINVCMIGFGRPNRQIFLTSVANNQFLTKTANGVDLKKVDYHIFDKGQAENNKNLNHLYYRYKANIEDMDAAEYLPLPSLPANEIYHHIDINNSKFYQEIREIIAKRKTDVNFIIVSFESDLENIDMAQKLLEKRREWGVDNVVIFVRVKKAHDDHFIFKEKNVFFIGEESECAYNIDCITNDKIFQMAQMRNEIYDLEYHITTDRNFAVNEKTILENRESANKKWFAVKNQLERESSLYCCLSLQSKLNLMGLEYCKVSDNPAKALTEQEYMNCYARDDMPDTQSFNLEVDGKKVVNYTLNFPESKRKNLAILEHYRWNSFLITKGMVPATKEQIIQEMAEKEGKLKYSNGRNYRLRRHGNLTTFDGLVEFRQMVAQRDNCDEVECDVIKYDYQLLDDAYWLLTKNGYKIIKRGC